MLAILTHVTVEVNHDWITHVVPTVPVVDTKYRYPENPTPLSIEVDQVRLVVVPVIVAPLAGVTNVGVLGAVVSRYIDHKVVPVSLVPVERITYNVFNPSVPVVTRRLYHVLDEEYAIPV